jgi:aminomuconate-semialdehyde/2-hydroxymuconate-6-semialdehyde dehydrogenase
LFINLIFIFYLRTKKMEKILNYIGGKLQEPVSGNYLDNVEPATGQVYSLIPDSNKEDVELAVQAAKQAFPSWSKTTKDERSVILYRISELILANLGELAAAESRDNGKPVSLAKSVDIPRAAHNFRFFATAILHFASESHHMEEGAINYTLKAPIGVAGCISPWNLPLYLFSWKIAPALASGNCVVAKPSEITPMSAYLLSKICIEAGLPRGVLNIVHGLGHKVGASITEHKEIPVISFTGGTTTGAQIAKVAAPMFKKLSLELGGKNPTLIFDDCNYDKMLKTVVRSSFANQGQICLCGSRLLIQSSIYDKFKIDFVREVKKLKVGNPKSPDTNQGALVSKPHMEKVLDYIEIAKNEGGKILCGGNQVDLSKEGLGGYFVEPTVIEGLDMSCRTNQEEIFGPVVTIMPFETEDEAVELSNATSYGLAASVWTENVSRTNRVADQLHMGIVWVNCWLLRDLRTPFGGVKNSGVGREGGFEALRFFTEPKNVCIKY